MGKKGKEPFKLEELQESAVLLKEFSEELDRAINTMRDHDLPPVMLQFRTRQTAVKGLAEYAAILKSSVDKHKREVLKARKDKKPGK